MSDQKPKVYFKNLDAFRFYGSVLIIVHHIEQNKSALGMTNVWRNSILQFAGPSSLNMFFTLSGFLITYLLLQEYNHKGRINIKSFYLRRVLKIWPLYFVLVILGFFILPFLVSTPGYNVFELKHYFQRLILFATFLPNVSYIINGTTPFIHQLWSIGVEEQFYISWPFLILLSPKKMTPVLIVLFGYLLTLVLLNTFVGSETPIYKIIAKARFSAMAIGGIAGYAVFYKMKGSQLFQNRTLGWLAFITLILFLAFRVWVPVVGYEVYSVLYAFIIVHLAITSKPMFSMENKIVNYFGKISYGLYMYHSLTIFTSIKLLALFNLEKMQFLVYTLSIGSTIFVSHISYQYFEKYFLKKKEVLSKQT
ncbi:MAG: acyltransferase [Ferruginibacter sp.]